MVSMGAVSHVCTNSCDRIRDVLILGPGYSDIVSVSLSLLLTDYSLASCAGTFSFVLPRLLCHPYPGG